ncbi:hypothetical protein [Paenibacillus tyrfis]|uniref:hypothetical protein n=1 Tax=Paenibacillus tyrfis TaxID=1501230 RepID=UPI00209EA590|nr:hypothetical protein [Paenibacillus tyrfis]MCP1311570.1 hypothetical protein [Paenibacillus tyrfis]
MQKMQTGLDRGGIVAIDGNVYTGKTTLCQYLKSKGFFTVAEYEPIVGRTLSRIEIQKMYVDQEQHRMRQMMRELRNGQQIFVLDRSFLSLSAHVKCLLLLEGIDIRESFIDYLEFQLKAGQVIIPRLFIYLQNRWDILYRRYLRGEASVQAKGTPTDLIRPEYYQCIDAFHQKVHRHWGEHCCYTIKQENQHEIYQLIKGIFQFNTDQLSSIRIMEGLHIALWDKEDEHVYRYRRTKRSWQDNIDEQASGDGSRFGITRGTGTYTAADQEPTEPK